MLPRSDVLRRCLLAAAVVTLGVVGGGTIAATPHHATTGTGTTDTARPAAGATLSGARGAARVPVISRDEARRTPPVVRAKPAPFRVQQAPAPIAHKPTKAELRAIAAKKAAEEAATPFTFHIGTLNVLGSQHTAGSSRWASGVTRAGFTSSIVTGYGIDLMGLQEVQDDQLGVFMGRLGAAGYAVWPARTMGHQGERLQIAYRTSMFELVEGHSITTLFDHMRIPLPYALFRNRATGGEFWMMTIHNSPNGLQTERNIARGEEIALINRLRATGKPVLLTGDMNEKDTWLCPVAASTGLVSANGGHYAGGCVMPPAPVKIDWIMGGGGATFSGYADVVGGLVSRATDHTFPHATVTVSP